MAYVTEFISGLLPMLTGQRYVHLAAQRLPQKGSGKGQTFTSLPSNLALEHPQFYTENSAKFHCQEGHPLTCQGLVAKVEAKSASGRPIRRDSPLQLVSSCLVVFCFILLYFDLF